MNLNPSHSNRNSRSGISLVIVLTMMIAATVMATAVYYMISRYNQRSGQAMYSESAIAATKAGEASAKAWFTYEGGQAINLVRAYLDECETTDVCKPIQINMNASYTQSANIHRQDFKTYLVGVIADTNNANAPVAVKIEVHGTGQGINSEPSKAVATVIYNLNGMNYQRPPPTSVTYAGVVWGNEAIFISGSAANITKGLNVNKGDVYLGTTAEINAKMNVKGNITSAITNSTVKMNGNVSADSNAYFGSKLDLNGRTLTVNGNMYAKALWMDGGSGAVIVGADTVFGKGGDLWVDSIDGAVKNVKVLTKGGYPNGNLTIQGKIGGSNGDVYAMGDFHIMSGAIWDISNIPNLDAGQDLFVDINCGIKCPVFEYAKVSGSTGKCFINSGWLAGNVAACYEGPTYSSFSPMANIKDADRMLGTKAALEAAGTGKKQIPYYLSDTTRVKYQKSWEDWRDGFCGTKCQSQKTYYLTGADWDIIYDSVVKVHPEYLQSTYLYALMDSTSTMQWAGMSTTSAADMTVSHNFVFYFRNDPELKYAYGNTTTSRVIWWSQKGFKELHSVGDIYGIVYAQDGDIKVTNGELRVHGQMILANDAKNITTNDSLHLWFDDEVLSDISEATGLMRVPGTPDSPTPPTTMVKGPWVISASSPRLNVETVSMTWGPAGITNWESLKSFGRSVFVQPSLISFTVGDYVDWNVIESEKQITKFVMPDSARTACGVDPEATTTSTSAIDFNTAGTYVVTYTADCSDGGGSPSGALVVWIKPVMVVASSIGAMSSSLSSTLASSAASSPALSSGASPSSSAGAAITYEFGNMPTCSSYPSDTELFIGGKITNNSGVAIDLHDYRMSYYIYSNLDAVDWAWEAALNYSPSVTGVPSLKFWDINRAGQPNPHGAGTDYTVMAQVTWPTSAPIAHGSFGYFSGLKVKEVGGGAMTLDNDYSENGCMSNWGVNPWVVFEKWDGSQWNVVAGTKPPYSVVSTSSSAAVSSSVVSSSSAAAGCTVAMTSVAMPVASDWVVTNDWNDGTHTPDASNFTNVSSSLQLNHRVNGEYYVKMIEKGHGMSVISGATYSINFNFKDNATSPITKMEVGFADGYGYNQAFETSVLVSTTVNSSTYTPIHAEVVAPNTGTRYLMIRIEFGTKSVILTYNIKDVNVYKGVACGTLTPGSSAAMSSSAIAVSSSVAAVSSSVAVSSSIAVSSSVVVISSSATAVSSSASSVVTIVWNTHTPVPAGTSTFVINPAGVASWKIYCDGGTPQVVSMIIGGTTYSNAGNQYSIQFTIPSGSTGGTVTATNATSCWLAY